MWWRFLGHGSGKYTCTPASESGAIMSRTTSTASCWTMRRLEMADSSMRCSSEPTPALKTSTPRKLSPGRARAIFSVVSPMPKPISRMVGAWRPKAAAMSRGRGAYGTDHLPISCSSASRWRCVMWPRRCTKLRIWVAPGLSGACSALASAAWVASLSGAPSGGWAGVFVFIG
ncbi:Uncharacterised protein [Bordetella pertussis]|nr:Uncharacterised protein [Bordetella pertussis]